VADLAEQVAALGWYHTIELPGGVVTPGMFDLRRAAAKVPIPESLAGKRCLDVGTADGFWAFELERRGAAEVVAIDLIDPSKRDITVGANLRKPLAEGESSRQARAFEIAHDARGSKVDWRNLSVYDLSPEAVGEFDFVFMGSLLVHLRDPVLALQTVRTVTRGEFMSYDAISPWLSITHPRQPAATLSGVARADWWIPNVAGLRRMIEAGGFTILRAGGVSFVTHRGRLSARQFVRNPFRNTMLRLGGIAQSWVIARPAHGARSSG
jgi:tRNA (mo5U34)-methyltransferase